MASRRSPSPPAPPPPGVLTPWASHTASTARHTPHGRTAHTNIPLPRTTCHTQSNPPPSKKPRTHKHKKPMHPKRPPTKRDRDTEDPLPHKTRSDTYAPKPVAPPNPLALTAPTDGLPISSEFQPPLHLQPSSPRQRHQGRNLFRSPPIACPNPPPPPATGFISANSRVNPN